MFSKSIGTSPRPPLKISLVMAGSKLVYTFGIALIIFIFNDNYQFDNIGFYSLGDNVQYDNNVYTMLGRSSIDIIKTGGFKVSALQVETEILRHPDIVDCAVVGLPDLMWGQKV